VANHSGPESCGMDREVHVEALTGETDRPAIEPRNSSSGMPTLLSEAEGNMAHDDNRKSCADPARSETLSMSGSLSYGSSEISSVSCVIWPDRCHCRKVVHFAEIDLKLTSLAGRDRRKKRTGNLAMSRPHTHGLLHLLRPVVLTSPYRVPLTFMLDADSRCRDLSRAG